MALAATASLDDPHQGDRLRSPSADRWLPPTSAGPPPETNRKWPHPSPCRLLPTQRPADRRSTEVPWRSRFALRPFCHAFRLPLSAVGSGGPKYRGAVRPIRPATPAASVPLSGICQQVALYALKRSTLVGSRLGNSSTGKDGQRARQRPVRLSRMMYSIRMENTRCWMASLGRPSIRCTATSAGCGRPGFRELVVTFRLMRARRLTLSCRLPLSGNVDGCGGRRKRTDGGTQRIRAKCCARTWRLLDGRNARLRVLSVACGSARSGAQRKDAAVGETGVGVGGGRRRQGAHVDDHAISLRFGASKGSSVNGWRLSGDEERPRIRAGKLPLGLVCLSNAAVAIVYMRGRIEH